MQINEEKTSQFKLWVVHFIGFSLYFCLPKNKQANLFFVDFFLINFFLFKKTHSLIPTTH